MKSGNITVSDARLKRAIRGIQETTSTSKTQKMVEEAKEEVKLKKAKVTKFYINNDTVEAELNGETVECKLLQLFGPEFVLKYAPTGDYEWDAQKATGYIVPRSPVPCVVLPVSSETDEYFVIGYYNEYTTQVKPPALGNVKLSYISAVDEFLVQFGSEGFNTVTNHLNQYTGYNDDYTKPIDELPTKDTLKEYYTKAEVDKIIEDLRKELKPTEENNDSTQ